jgi:hypothetical protein
VRICRTCGSFLEAVAEGRVEGGENPRLPSIVDDSLPVFKPTAEKREENSETLPDMDEREEIAETPLDTDEARPLSSEQSWRCPQCHKPVPNTFDVCWNCGTSQDGTPDPSFVKEPLEIPCDVAEEEPMTQGDTRNHGPQCPKCGSSKIIPKARILDQGQGSDGDLKVVIYGNPKALIFKDRLYGKLMADICGDCGHVELRVENAEELYDHYEASE